MKLPRLTALLGLIGLVSISTVSCSKTNKQTLATAPTSKNANTNTITVDNGEDAPTVDPVLAEDVTSARVLYDLFEGLTSFDQNNQTIPGLADKWETSPDGKTYTFHLRPNLKFSDGSAITANDVVFSWQRLADPKVASPYNNLALNIVNGKDVIAGKLPVSQLGVTALDSNTIQIKLNHPDPSFLQICAMPNVAVVSQANVKKFGTKWTQITNMVTSGAYKIQEWVIKGHMTLSKNPNYYDAKNVAIEKIKFMPIVDTSASFNQYKSGDIDITYSMPVDQYKTIIQEYANQAHTVTQEALYYYDLNMTIAKFAQNRDLRQALSMAVDRNVLTKDVLGQGQSPLYSYTTATIEGGKFADTKYEWASWPRDKQLALAKELFAKAGYGANHPLELSISYNTNDAHKKIALAIASMWQQAFGATAIKVTSANQEWKTFIQARNQANYDIARDGWVADYNSVDSYTSLFLCKDPTNKSKYCNPEYDKLILQAQNTSNPEQRIQLIHQALEIAQNDYAIIPLYQYSYYRLINPRVKGYEINNNHFDHVMSKWYKLN
ncbi:MAG: hypothetical protein RLZZ293_268 [Pseudomonadota bacterium]|jgi:oligopeptide transport system substrate-binding protein